MEQTISRYILISGASSGIGKAAAEALAKEGMTVFAGASSERKADAMRAEGVDGIVPIALDVTSMDSIDAAMDRISTSIGPRGHLHGLVNSAGVDVNAPLHALERHEIAQMANVNYLGGIMLTHAALPLLRRGPSRIVFISSASALLRSPTVSIYCSTKAGIEGFADSLRLEMIPVGIKVSIIEPGIIRTPMVDAAMTTLNTMLARLTETDRRRYEPTMRKIAQVSVETGSGTEVTTAAIRHALTAPNPRRRYRVGIDCKVAAFIGALPHGVQDWVLRRTYGI